MNPQFNQSFVDRIVQRAQNSAMGLGEPKSSYSLDQYEGKGFDDVALLLVNAHVEKFDLVSLMSAAMEQAAIFGEETAAAKRSAAPKP